MLSRTTMKRLSFVKYLFKNAISQSKAPSPLNCASLLTMHDSIEMFLLLASEHLDAGAQQLKFMEYWDVLSAKLEPRTLQVKESCRHLNRARVALKHHGIFHSGLDIAAFRECTSSFFESNTPLVFGIEFGDVSLIEFVTPESSRSKLREAVVDIQQGDTAGALVKTAIAFDEMLAEYEGRKRRGYRASPFFFGDRGDFTFLSGSDIARRDPLHGDRGAIDPSKLGRFVNTVRNSMLAMQEAIKILALGLDYRRYSRFRLFAPRVSRVMSGEAVVDIHSDAPEPSESDAMFCIDFVIESSLALAEFDYTVSPDE